MERGEKKMNLERWFPADVWHMYGRCTADVGRCTAHVPQMYSRCWQMYGTCTADVGRCTVDVWQMYMFLWHALFHGRTRQIIHLVIDCSAAVFSGSPRTTPLW